MIFIYSKVIRLLKKKSHQHIVRLSPEEDPNLYPIDVKTYNSFIFIKDPDEEYIVCKLNKFIGVDDSDEETINQELDEDTFEKDFNSLTNKWSKDLEIVSKIGINDIELYKNDSWLILKIKNSCFLDFNTLVWWLNDDSSVYRTPTNVIGFCQNKKNPQKDYIIKIDKESKDDLIGSFRSHQNFGIYLPNACLKESGNISLSRNHEINFYSELSKIPIELIDKKMIPFEKMEQYYRQ